MEVEKVGCGIDAIERRPTSGGAPRPEPRRSGAVG